MWLLKLLHLDPKLDSIQMEAEKTFHHIYYKHHTVDKCRFCVLLQCHCFEFHHSQS